MKSYDSRTYSINDFVEWDAMSARALRSSESYGRGRRQLCVHAHNGIGHQLHPVH